MHTVNVKIPPSLSTSLNYGILCFVTCKMVDNTAISVVVTRDWIANAVL